MFNSETPTANGQPAAALKLLILPPMQQMTAVITSDDVVETQTHFYHGALIRCSELDCPACSEDLPATWRGWLSVFFVGSNHHLLFSIPAQDADEIADYRAAHGSLRGCLITATRTTIDPYARTISNMQPVDLDKIPIPDEPDLPAAIDAAIGPVNRPQPLTPS